MGFSSNKQGGNVSRPTPIYKDWTVLQLAALLFLLDQFTKYLVRQLLPFGWSYPTEGLFRFTHVHNTGSAFGILQGLNTPLIFVSFIGIIILVLIYRSQPRPSNWLRLSLGLQLGGAFGNLLDRLRLGFVTDFIDIGPWPVFNLADASIVTGLVLLAWIFLRSERKDARETATGAVTDVAGHDGYQWCPLCEGEMVNVPDGWHCIVCGVKERIDTSGLATDKSRRTLDIPPQVVPPSLDGRGPISVGEHDDAAARRPADVGNDAAETSRGSSDGEGLRQTQEQRSYSETERP